MKVYVGGNTAFFEDFSDKVASRLPLFIAVVIGLSVLLLIAGHETTTNLIGNGIATLCTHRDELARAKQLMQIDAIAEKAMTELGLDADHGVVRARHADVALKRRAARQEMDTTVGRAQHRGHRIAGTGQVEAAAEAAHRVLGHFHIGEQPRELHPAHLGLELGLDRLHLFFEIMQREIWNGAQVDTLALQDYYTRNKQKYVWQRSADAVLFYANDSATAKGLQTALAKKPKAWRAIWEPYSQSVVADSARFELDQLPGTAKGGIKVGTVTQPTANADNSFAFAYVVQLYNSPAQRTFAEARNQVLADYQASLEKDWVESLKKKYEVKINEQLLNQVLSKADRSPL